MKTVKGWSFKPYNELHRRERGISPYICRLAPRSGGFTVDFIDNGLNVGLSDKVSDGEHIVFYRVRGEGEYTAVRPELKGHFYTADIDCEDQRDFEV